VGTGDAEWLPGGGLTWIWMTRKLPEGGTIYAGPIRDCDRIKRSRCIDGDSLP
jgi:hypothetical protein